MLWTGTKKELFHISMFSYLLGFTALCLLLQRGLAFPAELNNSAQISYRIGFTTQRL